MADISINELIALGKAIEPLVEAYRNDQLTKEERIFLESVFEVLGPVLSDYIAILWKDLYPTLSRLNLWLLEE